MAACRAWARTRRAVFFTWTGIAQQLIGVVEGRPMPQAMDDNEWAEPWTDGD